MSAEFDSFLVKARIGGSRTLRRLTPAERWCYVAGVLALAAESPIRGALLIAEGIPVTVADLAAQAGVPKSTAASSVEKLCQLGKLEHDDELGCLIVVRWHHHQPEPKPSDSREAWRERKRRQRERERDSHAGHTRDVTPSSRPEVEVGKLREEKTPPKPPASGGQRRQQKFQEELRHFVDEHFPNVPAGLVAHQASQLRSLGREPTVEALRPLLEEHAA